MIEIQELSKSYGAKQVLHTLNLRLESGTVYGIVGENGAGKTTLFRCIADLEGHSGLVKSNFDNLKNHLGFLPTNPYFLSKITGKEYLQLLCNGRGLKMPDLARWNLFELPLDQYAETYSTGMKKKLALTGILLQKNDFFILDEPFNGVDIQSNMMIVEIIKRLKAQGKTIIIASHIFSTLNETCDEIHVIKEGRLVRQVFKKDFAALDQSMKDFVLGNKISQLDL